MPGVEKLACPRQTDVGKTFLIVDGRGDQMASPPLLSCLGSPVLIVSSHRAGYTLTAHSMVNGSVVYVPAASKVPLLKRFNDWAVVKPEATQVTLWPSEAMKAVVSLEYAYLKLT